MCGKNITCPSNAVCQSLEFALLAVGLPVGPVPARRFAGCAGGNPWLARERVPTATGAAPARDGSRDVTPIRSAG